MSRNCSMFPFSSPSTDMLLGSNESILSWKPFFLSLDDFPGVISLDEGSNRFTRLYV